MKKLDFSPAKYSKELTNILKEIIKIDDWDNNILRKILRKYPKDGKYLFSKDQLLSGYEYLVKNKQLKPNPQLRNRLIMKPTRTLSGVSAVTVLTKPYPCPGNCIFCPNIPDMPKSYLPSEPGAQRAVTYNFDPYLQVYNRLKALQNTGHNTDKVELIVIGGTWSYYPESYQIWFVKECFRALNKPIERRSDLDFIKNSLTADENASWDDLYRQHGINQKARHRCVGLSFETRPDQITQEEAVRMRKLGATKVQIGIQSLDDKILKMNNRQHTIEHSKNAFKILRSAGFKIHAHWMVNLYGSNHKKDVEDYKRLWNNDFRPDEVKIYPTSIIKGTKLYDLYQNKRYKPYSTKQLTSVIKQLMLHTPKYCRLTRVIRDIPSPEIIAGNTKTNLRQIAEQQLIEANTPCTCIRCREIKSEIPKKIKEEIIKYETPIGKEIFISYITSTSNKIVGFLRLLLPAKKEFSDNFLPELQNSSIIREIHVYGKSLQIGSSGDKASQHSGIGKNLINIAEKYSSKYKKISVIQAVGTTEYYKKLGFRENGLYMSKKTSQ
ncbi:tRNA uridine(34) 5-carboxymethylaminomethyl modification radical SAM/GNAT enzyme Elp3 [Candidatus Dojkabacteria bacterium]|nr:tRNA uridine(34) 5-carboxymethylaminomethyl modification radical SAM/GNAT enzyme Elp3 [Candidatus Dojkabacteria bacterium]